MVVQYVTVILVLCFTVTEAKQRCWGAVCIDADYVKTKSPDNFVTVFINPLLLEIFKVDDLQFTISFSMWLGLNWMDNRLKIEPNQINSGHQIVSPNSIALTQQNKKLLDHIWIPEIYIPHRGLTKCRHGDGFYDEVVNILVKNKSISVDYWTLQKPTITCSMIFNWFPFDQQNCIFLIQGSIAEEFMELINIHKAEEMGLLHFQNTLVDYEISIAPTPKQNMSYKSHSDSLDEFYGMKFAYIRSQTGFVFQLKRRWTRYIFIYYIPSSLCVITSWVSFLISPQVIPGRMSLLVTLFLSLTTLLVSTVSSSPPVAVGISALTAWIIIQYVFLITAIMAYAFLLAFFRFSDGIDEKKKKVAKDIDRSFITVFPIIYFIITLTYWSICLFNLS